MNKALFVVSIITSASLGFFVGKSHNSPEIAAFPAIFSEQAQTKTPPKAKSTPAVSEKSFQVGSVATSVDAQIPPDSISPDAINQSAQQQIDAVRAEYELKERSEKFTDWLTKNQKEKAWFDLGVEMRGRFEAEERDYNWASAEEGRIQSLFTQKEELAGIAIKSTNCKTTQCEITVSVINQDHANETAMAITKVLGAEKFSHIIIDNQAQQGESTFYVARDEKGFEFN